MGSPRSAQRRETPSMQNGTAGSLGVWFAVWGFRGALGLWGFGALGFRALGFRVLRVCGLGLQGFGFWGFGVSGLGFRV